MATVSAMEEREDSILEAHRTSLLEVIEDKNRSLNKKSLVHRLVYIAKFREDNVDRLEIGNHYEHLFKNLQNVYQNESVSGLLLMYLKYMVHVVETSSDMITEVVRDIVASQRDGGFLQSMKILVISHDISFHILYQQWSFKTLDIQAARLEAYETSDSVVRLVVDMLGQLIKLGNYILKQPKLNLKNAMDSLHDKVPDLLPQQGMIQFLLEENDNCMVLPEEFLNLYDKPFDVTLDSGLVWPLPTRLFPYN
ncbi:hypothetical protein ScPMuIL_005067 [Solemya velum]